MLLTVKERKSNYNKEYYLKNKEGARKRDKIYKDKHREILREKNTIYRKNNPNIAYLSRRKAQLKRKFNLSLNDYNILLEKQKGVCNICKIKETTKALCVDHNHTTGEIRGLLCSNCNRGIGLLKDDIVLLKEAIKHLSN